MALKRITVTIPRDVLAAADRKARELGRSRSWVVAEAVRAFAQGAVSVVREPVPTASEAAVVEEARRRHLTTDLTLPPAERLRRAEELARVGRLLRPGRARRQVIGFDTYEDFYDWKKARHAGA